MLTLIAKHVVIISPKYLCDRWDQSQPGWRMGVNAQTLGCSSVLVFNTDQISSPSSSMLHLLFESKSAGYLSEHWQCEDCMCSCCTPAQCAAAALLHSARAHTHTPVHNIHFPRDSCHSCIAAQLEFCERGQQHTQHAPKFLSFITAGLNGILINSRLTKVRDWSHQIH